MKGGPPASSPGAAFGGALTDTQAAHGHAHGGGGGELTLRPLTGTPEGDDNTTVEGPFKLSPARGVFGTDGHETFRITFAPSQTQFTAKKAVLMLRAVPRAAVQDDMQASHLSQLAFNGHGDHCRLLSWLESLGGMMPVPDPEAAREQQAEQAARLAAAAEEEAEEDDDASSLNSADVSDLPAITERVLSLRAIRDIAFNHANGQVLPSDMFALEQALRMVIVHTHHWVKGQEEESQDDPEAALPPEPMSPEEEEARAAVKAAFDEEAMDDKVSIFYVPPPPPPSASPGKLQGLRNNGPLGPELVDASFSLRHNHVDLATAMDVPVPPSSNEEGEAENGTGTGGAARVGHGAQPEEEGEGEESVQGGQRLLRYSASQQEVPPGADVVGALCRPGALLPAHEAMLDRILLLPSAAVRMLGPYLAEALDSQVKHEAVDYLREKALRTVSCLSVTAGGEGKAQVISLSPPLLAVGGELPMEKTWTGKVVLRNPSSAIAEVEFCQELMSVSSNVGPGEVTPGSEGADGLHPPAPADTAAEGEGEGEGDGDELGGVERVGGSNSNSNTELVRLNKLQVELDPPRMLLMPFSEATVTVHVTAFCLGDYSIHIPMRGANGANSAVDSLNIAVKTCGPKLRFLEPEVDMGLAGVGTSVTQTFSIANDGATPAAFSFDVLTEAEVQAAVAAAHSVNEDGSPKDEEEGGDDGIPRATSADSDDGGFGEPSHVLNVAGGGSSTTADGTVDETGTVQSPGTIGAPQSQSVDLASKMTGFSGIGKFASTVVEPAMGTLMPGEVLTLTATCQGGTTPQRVRGAIRCSVGSSMQEVDPMPDQFLSFRCEVQAPKTVMYPMAVDVGEVYLGVPVYFEVTTANICNLPAAYKLERPGGDSPAYSLVFDRPEGPLGAKEKVTVRAEFTALTAGPIDDIIANKIRGVAVPLGFVLTGEAKPPLADTVPLGLGDPFLPAPAPLAHASMPRFPDGGQPPAALGPQPLDFGGDVALYERKKAQFCVRNLSPVPMTFRVNVLKYSVKGDVTAGALSGPQDGMGGGKRSRGGANSTRGATSTRGGGTALTTTGNPSGKLLVPREDGANKFRSVDGRKYAEASVQRRENRLFLTSGLGGSYLLDCDGETEHVELEPWGVRTVTVHTFNDMPGTFDDRLEVSMCDALGLGWSKVVGLPLRMTVTGCPLILDKSTYGMTEQKAVQFKDDEEGEKGAEGPAAAAAAAAAGTGAREQMLSFGFAPVNADPVSRDLVVVNNGSMPGQVTWKIRAITGELNGPVKVTINVDEEEAEDEQTGELREEMKVRTVLGFWADEAKDVPFDITPSSAVVEPYGKMKFKLTMFKTHEVAHETAKLVGSVKFADPAPAQPPAPPARGAGAAAAAGAGDGVRKGGAMLEGSLSATSIANDASAPGNSKGVPPGSVAEESTLIPAPSAANQSYRLNLLLDAEVVNPAISIDKKLFVAAGTDTAIPLTEGGIKFRASAADIFGRGPSRKACQKFINVVNPTETTLTCTVSAEGHFTLASATDDTRDQVAAVKRGKGNDSLMSQTLGAGGTGAVRTSFGADSLGKTITLTPHAAYSFALGFTPSRSMRATIAAPRDVTVGGSTNQEDGSLVVSFNTGQRLSVPLLGSIATPFIIGSAPKVNFGVCRVGANCDGLLLLTNPTPVAAKWTVKHVPPVKSEANRRKKANDAMAIRVPGYSYPDPEVDEPNVFIVTPSAGVLAGPTVTVTAATAAMPKDVNRTKDAMDATADKAAVLGEVVPQRLSETSWSSSTLTMKDALSKRHDNRQDFEADANFPSPVTIQFRPIANKRYGSRFRFTCEFGNSFDVMLYGDGTYEEHEHAPRYPKPGFKGAESHLSY